jgi:CheY-like chemotaxis protein
MYQPHTCAFIQRLMTILIAEDDQDDVDILLEALMRIDSNLKVIVSPDGFQCLKKLQTVAPDIVLLDINMPLMNGRECLAAIRKNPDLKNVNVVMYSTSIFPHDVSFFEQHNADYFIKPVNFSMLVQTLNDIIVQTAENVQTSD